MNASDELVSAVATEMRRHLKAEVMDDRAAEVWAFVVGIDDAARAIIPLVLEHAARLADALEADANAYAYERRKYGKDDNFHCGSASAAAKIAAAIRGSA